MLLIGEKIDNVMIFDLHNGLDMLWSQIRLSMIFNIDLSHARYKKADSTHIKFYNYRRCETIDLSSIQFTNTTTTADMFRKCDNLRAVYAYNCNEYTCKRIQRELDKEMRYSVVVYK